jgi:hypothetical protein
MHLLHLDVVTPFPDCVPMFSQAQPTVVAMSENHCFVELPDYPLIADHAQKLRLIHTHAEATSYSSSFEV